MHRPRPHRTLPELPAKDDIMLNDATIDHTVLDQIREIQPPGADDLVGKIIGLFIDESARLQGCLAQAVNDADCDAVRQYAHSLKSCSGNVGARKLALLSQELEYAGRDGEQAKLPELMDELRTHLSDAVSELQSVLAA